MHHVQSVLSRLLWEAQTPQVMRTALLRRGFTFARENNLMVTDDASLLEALGVPVKLTRGEYTNLKVTTPEDIALAESILKSSEFKAMSPSKDHAMAT